MTHQKKTLTYACIGRDILLDICGELKTVFAKTLNGEKKEILCFKSKKSAALDLLLITELAGFHHDKLFSSHCKGFSGTRALVSCHKESKKKVDEGGNIHDYKAMSNIPSLSNQSQHPTLANRMLNLDVGIKDSNKYFQLLSIKYHGAL